VSEPATFDAAEFARRLDDGHTAAWVSTQATAGVIPSRKVGKYRRYTAADLDAYLESVREGGDAPRLSRLTRKRKSA
jgi:hypothetical protein